MRRSRRLIRTLAVVSLASLLVFPAATALRANPATLDLEKVDPDSGPYLIEFQLINDDDQPLQGTYETSLVRVQAYDQDDLALIQDWLQIGTPLPWQLEVDESTTIELEMNIPPGAHSGPFELRGIMSPTGAPDDADGEAAGAIGEVAFQVLFVIRGVDVIGQVALPRVMEPDEELDQITLSIGNYLDELVSGYPVQEIRRDGEVVRTFNLSDQEKTMLPSDAGGGTEGFPYTPDLTGLPVGEYTVHTSAMYQLDGAWQQSRAKIRPLTIGVEAFQFQPIRLESLLGIDDFADGAVLQVPRTLTPTLEVQILNVGDLFGVADLRLSTTGPGDPTSVARTFPLEVGANATSELPLTVPTPGTYTMRLEEEQDPFWNGTLESHTPVVRLEEPTLQGLAVDLAMDNEGVRTRTCYSVEVRTAFNQTIPGREGEPVCQVLLEGERWDIEAPLDTDDLPLGSYVAFVTADWIGRTAPPGPPAMYELPFTLEQQGFLPPGFDFLGALGPVFWGLVFLAVAALAFILFGRRRKRDDPEDADEADAKATSTDGSDDDAGEYAAATEDAPGTAASGDTATAEELASDGDEPR